MNTIINYNLICNNLPNWKPNHLAYIIGLEIKDNELIILFLSQERKQSQVWPNDAIEFNQISFSFYNVESLLLKFDSIDKIQITGFDIIDISENNLENINFKVEDYENGIIEFKCKTIKVNFIK